MPNTAFKIRTNDKTGSIKTIEHNVISFDKLWDAYPTSRVTHKDPSTGNDVFSDHCAINVSQALYDNGILMKSFRGTRCWRCPTPSPEGKGVHAIRAQELADYLAKRPFAGCPVATVMSGADFEEKISGKQGIIFFQNYWQRPGESGRTGDHIDLWKNNRLASLGFFASQMRLVFPDVSEQYLSMSNLKRASKVLFWDMSE
ncbi:type VI secretion system amidase effector protein Tae4 [Aeromonas veronii]|uniref:type VI secretion system amidase effector protein Tae4 n=1 Tax=Aeromonas veronii TaxID=654 RepID=UPI003261DA81